MQHLIIELTLQLLTSRSFLCSPEFIEDSLFNPYEKKKKKKATYSLELRAGAQHDHAKWPQGSQFLSIGYYRSLRQIHYLGYDRLLRITSGVQSQMVDGQPALLIVN